MHPRSKPLALHRTVSGQRSHNKMKHLTDDVVIHIASFMDAVDMLNIALTCRRFGSAVVQDLSLVEQGARQLIECSTTLEKSWVPYKKGKTTWIGLYHELVKLRSPPSFSSILGSGINYVNQNKYHLYLSSLREQYRQQQIDLAKWHLNRRRNSLMNDSLVSSSTISCAAIGNHVMSHGVHFVRFTMTRVEKIAFGIIRPPDDYWGGRTFADKCGFNPLDWLDMSAWSKKKKWGSSNVHYCLYNAFPGSCQWTDWKTTSETIDNWNGMESALEGEIGLLLDLNEGTLAVYKNRQRLGIIKDGLSGEYCWVMSIQGASNSNAVQIKRGFFPDSSYECIH